MRQAKLGMLLVTATLLALAAGINIVLEPAITATMQIIPESVVNKTDVTVQFGRIGSEGQTKTKSFPNEAAAAEHAKKLIEEKTDKGYVEVQRPQ